MPVTVSDAYRAQRLRHKFKKEGGDRDRTRLFENFTSSIRSFMTDEAQLQLAEIPVLGYFLDNQTWLLLTTRRVIWARPGHKMQLKYTEIKTLGWSSGPPGAATREGPDQADEWIDTENGRQRTKVASPWLFIMDCSGTRHEALLDPYEPLLSIWNCILLMRRLEEAHPRADGPLCW